MIKEIKEPVGALYFNLSDPYQREEFETALKANKYKRFYDEIYDEVFRPHLKYNTPMFVDIRGGQAPYLDESELRVLEKIVDKINAFKESLDV